MSHRIFFGQMMRSRERIVGREEVTVITFEGERRSRCCRPHAPPNGQQVHRLGKQPLRGRLQEASLLEAQPSG
jgi:hypothetical protein